MLLNVRPSGKYLMEDFFYAGGLPAVLKELLPLLHREALTVTGQSLAANNEAAVNHNEDVIRPLAMPILGEGGTAVPSAPGAASVRVWQVMSRGRDPSTGTGPKPGAPAAGGRSCCLSSIQFCTLGVTEPGHLARGSSTMGGTT
jgi:Dehydratase family